MSIYATKQWKFYGNILLQLNFKLYISMTWDESRSHVTPSQDPIGVGAGWLVRFRSSQAARPAKVPNLGSY